MTKWMMVALLILTGCDILPSVVVVGRPIVLTDDQWTDYLRQLQPRMDRWFLGSPPALPSLDELRRRVEIVEVDVGDIATCDFQREHARIRIRVDHWGSGCVPHEFGHALLWMIDHECWRDFEHPRKTPSTCSKERG